MSATASRKPSPVTAAYAVRADICPQVVIRLIGYFAQQNLVPSSIRVRRWSDELAISIEQPGLDEHQAEIIAEKMRAIVSVMSVTLECRIDAVRAMPVAA